MKTKTILLAGGTGLAVALGLYFYKNNKAKVKETLDDAKDKANDLVSSVLPVSNVSDVVFEPQPAIVKAPQLTIEDAVQLGGVKTTPTPAVEIPAGFSLLAVVSEDPSMNVPLTSKELSWLQSSPPANTAPAQFQLTPITTRPTRGTSFASNGG